MGILELIDIRAIQNLVAPESVDVEYWTFKSVNDEYRRHEELVYEEGRCRDCILREFRKGLCEIIMDVVGDNCLVQFQ